MELTEKAKEDFQEYLHEQSIEFEPDMDKYPKSFLLENFSRHPFSMQWGVIVDFFTHKGYRPSIIDNFPYYHIQISMFDGDIVKIAWRTQSLDEARKQVLIMVCEFYEKNEK